MVERGKKVEIVNLGKGVRRIDGIKWVDAGLYFENDRRFDPRDTIDDAIRRADEELFGDIEKG